MNRNFLLIRFYNNGANYHLWEYFPIDDSWVQITNFQCPTTKEIYLVFTTNKYVFLGFGYIYPSTISDFWKFEPNFNRWTQISNIEGEVGNPVSFKIGDNIFITSSIQNSSIHSEKLYKLAPNW